MTGLLMKQEREWFWKEFAAMQSKNYSRIFPDYSFSTPDDGRRKRPKHVE